MSTTIEFWFDPTCPYTWLTSRWARELEQAGAVAVTWKVMSLGILNAGQEIPPEYEEGMRQGARLLRALVAAGEQGGSDAVGRLYDALGVRLFELDRAPGDDVLVEAVADAGLPAAVAKAADDAARDDAVRASHEEGQQRVGDDAGSPVTAYDGGRAFFGPVVVPAPKGDEAVTLLGAMTALSRVPAFSELKRARAAL